MALNIVQKIDNNAKIRNILISVFNKEGLSDFIPGLLAHNPEVKIYSTGGTYKFLQELLNEKAAKHLFSISEYTGQPEMQGGLVKTLDFKIYLGLLSETYNEAHKADLLRTGARAFDMVIVNLYPFGDVIQKEGITAEDARTHIDIGGPCMIRASAKNFLRVAVVTDKNDYPEILKKLETGEGSLSLETRFKLAQKAFIHTAEYDKAIAGYLSKRSYEEINSYYIFQ
ncbi:MAG: hypothetical protein JW904_04450 [Spirochaetales bacterium]|nr:hypothetical protein [Spirochaetales bacterium]